MCFCVCVFTQFKYKGEYEPLACLLFSHIWLAFVAATLRTIHLAAYSFNGRGASGLNFLGSVVGRAAEAILLILLITTADVGFPIRPAELSHFEQKVFFFVSSIAIEPHSSRSDNPQ